MAKARHTKLKNILIVYTGGTFGMSPQLNFEKLNSAKLKQSLFAQIPELRKIANCTVQVLFQIDSCQMSPDHWLKMANHLQEQSKHFDGIVVLHGTDTLPYSSAAISYLLSPTRIPIIFTGAQKPLAALRNDARTNLISAIDVAAHAPRELRNRVMIAFHDEVFLGTRVRKKSAFDFAAFESPRFPKLASIGGEIQYHDVIKHLPRLKKTPSLIRKMKKTTKQPQILRAEITPVFAGAFFDSALNGKNPLDAILLTLYTSGTAPTTHPGFSAFLKQCRTKKIPIFAITEREDAAIRLDSYPSGREMLDAGVVWCKNLTPEAAFVKIWLAQLLNIPFSKALSDES